MNIEEPETPETNEQENQSDDNNSDSSTADTAVRQKIGRRIAQSKIGKAMATAGKTLAKWAAGAGIAIGTWPVLVGCLVIFLLIMVIFGGLSCVAIGGHWGRTFSQPAGADSQSVKDLKAFNTQNAKSNGTGGSSSLPGGAAVIGGVPVSGFNRLDYLTTSGSNGTAKGGQNINPNTITNDKAFVEAGALDSRLAEALKYLTNKHDRLGISHIVSDYRNMDTNPEAGQDQNSQLLANISAHKDGSAADISEIDFVMKTVEPNWWCSESGQMDIVYYGDNSSGQSNQFADLFNIPTGLGDIDIINETANQNIALINEQLDRLNGIIPDISSSIPNPFGDKVGKTIEQINQIRDRINNNLNRIRQTQETIVQLQSAIEANKSKLKPEEIEQINQEITKLQDLMKQDLYNIYNLYNSLESLSNEFDLHLNTLESQLTAPAGEIQQNINALQNDLNALQSMSSIGFVQDLQPENFPELNINLAKMIDGKIQLSNWYLGYMTAEIKENLIPVIGEFLDGFTKSISGFENLLGGQNELLRLYCEGTIASVSPNTTYGPWPAQAIPIKVSWQNTKPDDAKVGNVQDESLSIDPRVYYVVYRPEARRKVHQLIKEALQFPYDMGDWRTYRITQLITLSQSRDVDPFKATLDKLYGSIRPANYGLFAMPEAWPHVHIAY